MTAEEAMRIRKAFRQDKTVDVDLVAMGVCIDNALEKQIPKKPVLSDEQRMYYVMCYTCPSCGENFVGIGVTTAYCNHCGQALDWSEEANENEPNQN